MPEITKKEAEKAVQQNQNARAEKKAKKSFFTEVGGAFGYGAVRELAQARTDVVDKVPGGMLTLDAITFGVGIWRGTKRSGGKMRDLMVGAGMVGAGHVGAYVGKQINAKLPA